ncbi:putative fad binding domain-containing protein [Colletotrichum karsti]|uniref:Fad binding domain-containing protein n=1 Tax=Colletotrichum karsti TaxID=1095194 RepID=A0A9P6HZI1_9PEZI|nr:putative fad binding domain-containing protein [Colletotrichum karsti]KAF9873022.1 putative fad binding domain-containing protein [Colletotrichum karsti]
MLAVLLQQQGIQVQVLEASDKLDEQPRACHYSGPAKYELQRAGVLDKICAEGFFPDGVTWRTKAGSAIVGLDGSGELETSINRIVCLELGRVIQILYDTAISHGNCQVLMKHMVTSSIGQSKTCAWVDVKVPSGETVKFEADYIVGCDGANSQMRRALFGDRNFPGWTWDQQIIASNVYYPFEDFGFNDSNFIVHPTEWYMAAKISKDGMWRVTYGDISGLTKEEYAERLPMRFKQILPTGFNPEFLRVANIGPYKMHQRLAESMRIGRFLLAGDAAHLCNPFGGYGLTSGIADVGCLYDALVGIKRGLADESILDKYSDIRSEKYRTIVDPMSTAGFRRLWEKNPETTIAEDEFFELLRKVSGDEKQLRQLRQGAMALRYDLTEFYREEVVQA